MAPSESSSINRASKVPDGGWGWVVVFGSTLIHFLIVGTGRCFGVFYLDLLDRFQKSSSATSWVVAIFNTMRMAFGPIAGMLCDRYTCRKVVICGGFVVAIGFIVTAFARSLEYTYVSFGVLAGFGASFLFTPSYVVVGKYFDKNKGKAMSISTLGAGLGTVALAPLIQLLLDTYSFFGAMLILGALMLHNILAGLLFRPLPSQPPVKQLDTLKDINEEPATENSAAPENATAHIQTVPVDKTEGHKSFRQTLLRQVSILGNVTFLLYGLQIWAMSICIQCFLSFLPAMAEEFGSNRKNASLLLSAVGIADMCGRFVWGIFFDLKRVRYRRRFFHTLLGLPVSVLAFVTGFVRSSLGLLGMAIVFGLIEGGYHSQRATIVSEFVAKDQMSSTVGFVIFFQGLGNLAGPPVAGYLRDVHGTYRVCYFFGGAVMFCTTLVFLAEFLVRKSCQKVRLQNGECEGATI